MGNAEPTPATNPMSRTKGKRPTSFNWKVETYPWTWPEIVYHALEALHGKGSLKELYALVESHPKTGGNEHWQARLRQVLEGSSHFVRVENGVWALASKYNAKKVAKFNRIRRKEHPLLGPRPKEDS
jgi:hypothetical protein